MTRTVIINSVKKVFRGNSVKEIVRKVEAAFPEITNWSIEKYTDRPGVYTRGDNDNGKIVVIPNC